MTAEVFQSASMSNSVLMKSAVAQPPTLAGGTPAFIVFRHPGYDSPSDILFRLPRLDSSSSTTSRSIREPPESPADAKLREQGSGSGQGSVIAGVHHHTALLACQIIANNAFDGYLATDREGQKRITSSKDSVLFEDTYWFVANRSRDSLNEICGRDVYPIVPSFQDWAFPHHSYASLAWETHLISHRQPPPLDIMPVAPPPSPRPLPDAPRCILSNSSYSLKKAHIIPRAQRTWFGDNVMATYGRGSGTVDDQGNKVHMRHDLHSVWDDHNFSLVPKGDDFAVHVLNTLCPGITGFAAAWHNVPVQKNALSHTTGEYLFSKFAQAVFMLLKPFITQSTVHRFVARMQAQVDDVRHGHKLVEEWLSGTSLGDLYSGGGSKGSSPRMSRKQSHSHFSVDLGNRGELDCHSGESDFDSTWYERNVRAASDSEDESEAGWYRMNIGLEKSDAGDEYGAVERGRSRKRRRCGQREQSAYTVDAAFISTS